MFSLSRAITQIDYTGVQSALNLSYEYDTVGNVKTVKQNGSIVAKYEYDEQNQLVSEILPQQNLKYEYVYDTCFNLRQVKTYQNGSETPTITEYGYADADWADLMTSYNGQAITYDAIGNPLTYNNGTAWTFTWQGTHDLATATADGKSISYHYDMDGVRDSKTINGVKHEYITQGGNVTLERWNDGEAKSLEFIYDNGGAPYSVIYTHGSTSETYYYILNQQGDVIRIVDGSGRTAAEYTYNGWGEILSAKQATGTTIGELNPIRYRGYYYDSELNMYYLQSRYYDPVVKRMLSADDESLTAEATLGDNNLFVYCDNDPVNRADSDGDFWHIVAGAVVGAAISGTVALASGERGFDLAVSVATGAAGGALSATTATRGVLVISNAVMAAASTAITEYKAEKRVSVGDVALSATVAATTSAIGGRGSGNKHLMSSGRRTVQTTLKAFKGGAKKGGLHTAVKKGKQQAVKSAKYYWKNHKKYYAKEARNLRKSIISEIAGKVAQSRVAKRFYRWVGRKFFRWGR